MVSTTAGHSSGCNTHSRSQTITSADGCMRLPPCFQLDMQLRAPAHPPSSPRTGAPVAGQRPQRLHHILGLERVQTCNRAGWAGRGLAGQAACAGCSTSAAPASLPLPAPRLLVLQNPSTFRIPPWRPSPKRTRCRLIHEHERGVGQQLHAHVGPLALAARHAAAARGSGNLWR